jgi:tRNA (guanine-N7-)-methyltransferase
MLYGRRKGPKLSAHQQFLLGHLLPQFELHLTSGADPRHYFASWPGSEAHAERGPATHRVDDVWLEVGFGGGEHLVWQAQHHPNIGIIGAEPYVNGVVKLLSQIDSLSPSGGEGQGEGAEFTAARASPPHPSPLPHWGRGRSHWNIRIYTGDARDILDALPDGCLGRVFILFPDPWPKTRHHKRRFMQINTLDELARVMRPGAELRFASDDAGYAEWTLERLVEHRAFEWTATRASDWQTRPPEWPPTRYEAKELHGKPAFLRFTRR